MSSHEPQPFLPASIRAGIYATGLYYSSGLLDSPDQGLYWLGYGGMTLSAVGLIRNLFSSTQSARHTARQSVFEQQSLTPSEIFGKSRLAEKSDPVIQTLSKRKGFFLGALDGSPLFFDPFAPGNGHMMTYAPSRSGKTTSVVVPAALHWFDGSFFNPAIKADVVAIAAAHREKMGHRVIKWNPFDVLKIGGVKINPLSILLKDIDKNGGENLHDLAQLIATTIVPDKHDEKEPFFRNGGRELIVALLLYAAVIERSFCTLPGLRKLVWSSAERKQQIAEIMKQCDAYGGLLQDYGSRLLDNLNPAYVKTFGPMRDIAAQATRIYAGHTKFGKSLMESEFSLEDMLDGKTTFFPILPEDKLETYGVFIGLLTALLIEMIGARKTPSPVMLLLEEAGNLGKIPNIQKAMTLLPERGARVWFIFQSRMQPVLIYGAEVSALLEEQCSMIQQWSIRDLEERKRWSARAGKTTVKTQSFTHDPHDPKTPWKPHINETERPVMPDDETARLSDDMQLIYIPGSHVIKATRIAYFQVLQWRRCAALNPYHPNGYPKNMPVIIDLEKGYDARK